MTINLITRTCVKSDLDDRSILGEGIAGLHRQTFYMSMGVFTKINVLTVFLWIRSQGQGNLILLNVKILYHVCRMLERYLNIIN